MIQDIYPDLFFNEYRPQAQLLGSSRILCYKEQRVLARLKEEESGGDISLLFPTAEMLYGRNWKDVLNSRKEKEKPVYAFAVNKTEYFLQICPGTDPAASAISVPECENPEPELAGISSCLQESGYAYLDIRQIRRNLPNLFGMVVFTGYHLHMWYTGRRFCGACGHPLIHDVQERAMDCPACGHKNYPRIMPAVIVGVISGDRILLTKYKEGYQYYALIAGFTEIGETFEETVAREVMEETGLRVKNIRYYKSQPWGIAGDILAGFYCDVDGSTDIVMDKRELKVAEWKTAQEIELQPDSYSLTNEMMRRFKEGKETGLDKQEEK